LLKRKVTWSIPAPELGLLEEDVDELEDEDELEDDELEEDELDEDEDEDFTLAEELLEEEETETELEEEEPEPPPEEEPPLRQPTIRAAITQIPKLRRLTFSSIMTLAREQLLHPCRVEVVVPFHETRSR
jgi:hypothetical protein